MHLLELIVHHALHQARFAHCCVANDDKLELMVMMRHRLICDHLERDLLDLLHLALLHLSSFSLTVSVKLFPLRYK